MKCEIIWNELSLQEWRVRFAAVKRSNILQSYEYGIANAKTYRQSARWGLIKINGQEAGMVQVVEASILWGAFHAIILDRGPLWFKGCGGAMHISAFFKEFNTQFPKRFGRKRRLLPEVDDGATALGILKKTGLSRVEDQTGYQSLWWDLDVEEDMARSSLKLNWLGSLKKAESSDLIIEWDDKGKFYPWLRTHYALDKAARGYNGISPKLLDNLATVLTSAPIILIGKAQKNKADIAGILILLHGQGATYQIGWSSDAGRAVNAHNLLLWQARQELKKYGIQDFDLGGVNEEASALGIKKFKTGTGATPYKLVGQYE
jgi:hypothetical protein